MLPKIFKLGGFIILFFFYSVLIAQNSNAPAPCDNGPFDEKIQIWIEPFELIDPDADIIWKNALQLLLRNALSEMHCFELNEFENSLNTSKNKFWIKGKLLRIINEAALNSYNLQLSLAIYADKSKNLIWKQTIDLDDVNLMPLNSYHFFGVDFSFEPYNLKFLALLKKSIQKSKELIYNKIISFTKNKYGDLDKSILQLMILPDSENMYTVIDEIKDPEIKPLFRSLARALADKGFIVKDLEESLKITQEKINSREFEIKDPFDIFIENAPSDILVYVEKSIDTFGLEIQVNLLLVAKDKYTAQVISTSPLLKSSRRLWTNITQPGLEALSKGIDAFSNDLDQNVNELLKYGRKTELTLEVKNSSAISLDKLIVENKSIADLVIQWIRENDFGQKTKKIGYTDKTLRMVCYIPIFDKYDNRQYPLDFGLRLKSFLQKTFSQTKFNEVLVQAKIIGARILIQLV